MNRNRPTSRSTRRPATWRFNGVRLFGSLSFIAVAGYLGRYPTSGSPPLREERVHQSDVARRGAADRKATLHANRVSVARHLRSDWLYRNHPFAWCSLLPCLLRVSGNVHMVVAFPAVDTDLRCHRWKHPAFIFVAFSERPRIQIRLRKTNINMAQLRWHP